MQDLKRFLNMLVPFDGESTGCKLMPDEYIRIVGLSEHSSPLIKYIRNTGDLENIISKYKYNYNLYITLATVKGKNGKKEDMYLRQVLMLDFDKKDYPELKKPFDLTASIKLKMPSLFIQCLVDTGHGYHCYISTERTGDIGRITHINKELCEILGADIKAVSPTQIGRIPTSFNLKSKIKPISVVFNEYGNEKCRPYSLDRLEQMINIYKIKSGENKSMPVIMPHGKIMPVMNCYCEMNMLAGGAEKGERNICLGRIVNYLRDICGYACGKALRKVIDWNDLCRPPKEIKEVTADFYKYWKGNYKMLGCKSSNPRIQKIIEKYCDKSKCKSVIKRDASAWIYIGNNLLTNKNMRKLRGNHYLVLSLLLKNPEGLTDIRLRKEFCGKSGKYAMSNATFKKVLCDLEYKKYISITSDKKYKINKITNYGKGCTRFSYRTVQALIDRKITQQDFTVYLCIVRNMQLNRDVTYDTLSSDLEISKPDIGKHINSLRKNSIIGVDKLVSVKGLLCNKYMLIA